ASFRRLPEASPRAGDRRQAADRSLDCDERRRLLPLTRDDEQVDLLEEVFLGRVLDVSKMDDAGIARSQLPHVILQRAAPGDEEPPMLLGGLECLEQRQN